MRALILIQVAFAVGCVAETGVTPEETNANTYGSYEDRSTITDDVGIGSPSGGYAQGGEAMSRAPADDLGAAPSQPSDPMADDEPQGGAAGAPVMGGAGGGAPVPQESGVQGDPMAADPGDPVAAPVASSEPVNLLLIFDRSSSMDMDWNGSQRWSAAGDAIARAVERSSGSIAMASAIYFPTPDPTIMDVCIDPTGITCVFTPLMQEVGMTPCLVPDANHEDQIAFATASDFLVKFTTGGENGAPTYSPAPGGFTPLLEGLQVANAHLSSTALSGDTVAIVVTDGEPNCNWDPQEAADIVSSWRAERGIPTHVIGLPGVAGAGPQLLNQLASAGGTERYIPATDPSLLEMQVVDAITQRDR